MKISTLVFKLLRIWLKYGNYEIDLVVENKYIQLEMPLGDIAIAPEHGFNDTRIKLLSKGFT